MNLYEDVSSRRVIATLNSMIMVPKVKKEEEAIQVFMKNGFDILAVYIDRTARYVNYSGKIIV
ncbi:MAG: hypothetical protein K2W99_05820 [Chthoniobacterales bacterium]|nr:hypothetical protein [Chthoniobacterales bacterium]